MREENPALTQPPPGQGSVPPPDTTPATPPPAARRGNVLAVPLAVLALAVAGVVGWQVYELRSGAAELRQEFAQRLAAADGTVAEVRGLARQQQESIAALQGKLGALEAQVAATEGQAAALEALYQEFSRTREDRVIAEVEQAIGLAAQQLQFAGNVEAALIALQGAEARLAALEPGSLPLLRRALQRDIEQLKAAPQVDVPGIALRLEGLLERVDTLPLAFAGELAPPVEPAVGAADGAEASPLDFVAALARDVWRELRTLVRVERLDQPEPVLLAPAQSTFLRENLKIRLLTARLALLAGDARTFAADLAQARNWIERFFDPRDPQVQEAIAELRALEATRVRIDPPELTESLAALRQLQARSRDQRPAQEPLDEPAQAPASQGGMAPSGTRPGGAAVPAVPGGGSAPQPADGPR